MEKFLLVLITIALATAPLRGAVAMPAPAAAGEAGRCAHLQHDAQGMDHAGSQHHATGDKPDNGCDQGCDGDCCNGACGTCVHAPVALPGATAAILDHYSNCLTAPVPHRFTGRTVHPPFRPPIKFS